MGEHLFRQKKKKLLSLKKKKKSLLSFIHKYIETISTGSNGAKKNFFITLEKTFIKCKKKAPTE